MESKPPDDEQSTSQQTETISSPLPGSSSRDASNLHLISIAVPIIGEPRTHSALTIFQNCNRHMRTDLWIVLGFVPMPPKPIESPYAIRTDNLELFVLVDPGSLQEIRRKGFLHLACLHCAVNLSPSLPLE
ncbi:hypothetical protein KR084_000123 [Drosophila pseudotakahashii]|nr:hypothetical protein KR084_000123 [Drosophila pseudotakahashii]